MMLRFVGFRMVGCLCESGSRDNQLKSPEANMDVYSLPPPPVSS